MDRTPRDASRDYNPLLGQIHNAYHGGPAAAGTGGAGGAGLSTQQGPPQSTNVDEAAIVRRFLIGTGLLSENEAPMSLLEMNAFVRGRMQR